jgi:hypothetical protein
MLAMDVNDDTGSLTPRGALRFIASCSLLQRVFVFIQHIHDPRHHAKNH